MGKVVDRPELRERKYVFADRSHAGGILAHMLGAYRSTDAVVLGIPAGGVPVAAVISEHLTLPLDVAVVSKMTLPWTTEAGYGAVAFDGTVRHNKGLLPRLGLTDEEIQNGVEHTTRKVRRRMENLRRGRAFPDLTDRSAILVDDGLASGFTMLVALEALRKAGSKRIIVAVPTAHREAVDRVTEAADTLYCANVRSGRLFAVAEAYENWSDVNEDEAERILFSHWQKTQRRPDWPS